MRNTIGTALLTLSLTLLATVPAMATTITITDAYAGQNPGEAKNNGDVIGLLRQFDAEKVVVTANGTAITAEIYFNYGQDGADTALGGITLGSFPTVHPGDLLIQSGSNRWAMPLINHTNSGPGLGGLLAGNLYRVQGFLTAGTVLNNTDQGSYRPEGIVWGDSTNAQQIGTGSRSVSVAGGNQLLVTLSLTSTDATFLSALHSAGTFFSFASATCANDLVEGTSEVPEPISFVLVGAGLAGIGLMRWRRG